MHIVLCNCAPDQAEALASAMVDERLAACVNVVAGVRSVYRWEGKVQRDTESTLILKTSEEAVSRLVARLQALHAYDTPEVLVLPVDVGLSSARYVQWVRSETGGTA